MSSDSNRSLVNIFQQLQKAEQEEKADIILRLIKQHPEHKLELPGEEGFQADLRHLDLSKASLESRYSLDKLEPYWSKTHNGMNMIMSKLTGSKLDEANLTNSYLSSSNLRNSNLQYSNLDGVELWNANLEGAFLNGAKITRADLIESNLKGADLENADFSGSFMAFADLTGANLTGANLTNANLWHANLRGAILDKTNFCRADLKEADFRHAVFNETNFKEADLRFANLNGAKMQNCKLLHVRIASAILDNADFTYTQFGEKIGEEFHLREYGNDPGSMVAGYQEGKDAYILLIKRFNELNNIEGIRWALRREKKMENQIMRYNFELAWKKRRWSGVVKFFVKYINTSLHTFAN